MCQLALSPSSNHRGKTATTVTSCFRLVADSLLAPEKPSTSPESTQQLSVRTLAGHGRTEPGLAELAKPSPHVCAWGFFIRAPNKNQLYYV